MSGRAYAKRRNVSAMAVSVAIKNKRLVKSIVRDEHGVPKIADPELADQEWAANTDLTDAPIAVLEKTTATNAALTGPPERDEWWDDEEQPAGDLTAAVGMSVSEASAVEKYWRSKLAEQKFKAESGELVSAAQVERRLTEVFHSCKVRLLGLSSRAKQAIPTLNAADTAALEALVREALEELAGPRRGDAQ